MVLWHTTKKSFAISSKDIFALKQLFCPQIPNLSSPIYLLVIYLLICLIIFFFTFFSYLSTVNCFFLIILHATRRKNHYNFFILFLHKTKLISSLQYYFTSSKSSSPENSNCTFYVKVNKKNAGDKSRQKLYFKLRIELRKM